jgi:hypothetical protein
MHAAFEVGPGPPTLGSGALSDIVGNAYDTSAYAPPSLFFSAQPAIPISLGVVL